MDTAPLPSGGAEAAPPAQLESAPDTPPHEPVTADDNVYPTSAVTQPLRMVISVPFPNPGE